MGKAQTGFQPRNTPAERRAFFDQQRISTDLEARVAALEAAMVALEARVTALESP